MVVIHLIKSKFLPRGFDFDIVSSIEENMVRIRTGLIVGCLLISAYKPVFPAPMKAAVSIEIKVPQQTVGMMWAQFEVTAKMPILSITLTAYLDKLPLSSAPMPSLPMVRGERRSVGVPINIPNQKPHWLFVEVDAILMSGERMKAGKSLLITPNWKNPKPETYETYRTEKPRHH